ncbi:MAG: hypothetical protein H6681_03860 [Desulfobacteraceae bacterium]|nr:hypothetical protein [Desulfobacteraceae bacterium]
MENEKKIPLKKSLIIIISTFFLLWIFAFIVGPFGEKHIPVFKNITKVIEENNIDSTAYMYTEIEGSYSGQKHLLAAMEHELPQKFGFTPVFISGIICCFTILAFAFRYLPMNDNEE